MLDADFGERLQAAQFERTGDFADDPRGIGEFHRGFLLALGLDDARALLADCFGLTRDGALHLRGNVEVLDLDRVEFDAPADAGRRQDVVEPLVDRGTVLEHLVEVALADRVAHRGLRRLDDRRLPIGDGGDDARRIERAEPQHGVDAHRDAVARDCLLRVERIGDGADVDLHDALDQRDQPEPARALGGLQPPEPEHDAAFIFLIDAERFERGQEGDRGDDRDWDEHKGEHGNPVGCRVPAAWRGVDRAGEFTPFRGRNIAERTQSCVQGMQVGGKVRLR